MYDLKVQRLMWKSFARKNRKIVMDWNFSSKKKHVIENDRSKRRRKTEKKIAKKKKLQKKCSVEFISQDSNEWLQKKQPKDFSKANLEFIHMMLSSGCEEANIWVCLQFVKLLKINRLETIIYFEFRNCWGFWLWVFGENFKKMQNTIT